VFFKRANGISRQEQSIHFAVMHREKINHLNTKNRCNHVYKSLISKIQYWLSSDAVMKIKHLKALPAPFSRLVYPEPIQ
jgi:hypothetical protein